MQPSNVPCIICLKPTKVYKSHIFWQSYGNPILRLEAVSLSWSCVNIWVFREKTTLGLSLLREPGSKGDSSVCFRSSKG